MPNSPLLYGPNNTAINLENQIIHQNTGMLLSFNGPKNYITYNNFENGLTTGWSLGTVGALTNNIPTGTPTFGSGSSVNLSLTAVTSGQLAGTTSLSLVSSAATTSGDMLASQAYTIDIEDQVKVLTFKFYYSPISGASNGNWSGTSSNSFGIAIWDVTNSVWLTSNANFGMTQSSGVGYVTGTCQTNATTASLRFVIYNANASAGAISVNFDDFFLGPQTAPFGPVMTDAVSYVPVYQGFGSPTTTYAVSKRVGDSIILSGRITLGTTTAVEARVGLPAGLSVSSAVTAITVYGIIGESSGTSSFLVTALGGNTYINFTNVTGGGALANSNGTSFTNSSSFTWSTDPIPVQGLSSNLQMSNDTDTRVISARAHCSASQSASTVLPANFDTVDWDTSGSITTGAGWNYKVPVSGYYQVEGMFSSATTADWSIYKNASLFATLCEGVGGALAGGAGLVQCNAGDTLDIRPNTALTITGSGSPATSQSWVSINRLSGPSVIAATESVNMSYFNTAGTSIANTGDNNVPFATKAFDSHNAYNTSTGIYTIPVSGKYSVTGTVNYASSTYGVNNQVLASVYKNTAIYAYGDVAPIMAIVTLPFGSNVTAVVSCNAGDTLEIRAQNTRTAGATTLNTGAGMNHIEIERIGN